MNNKGLVRLSNIVGMVSILLLIYWVFIFITIQVFGLKVFRKNITEIFYMSIMAILALMLAALIINIMFNLTRIAEKNQEVEEQATGNKHSRLWLIFGISLPVVFALLFLGDYISSQKKENMLIASAKSIVEESADKINNLVNYSFDKKWQTQTCEILQLVSKTDKNFQYVSVITKDVINQSNVFLEFRSYCYLSSQDTVPLAKINFMLETTNEEREYLKGVFEEHKSDLRFSAADGKYELYYPYVKGDKRIVLYFSDYQRYGKSGR